MATITQAGNYALTFAGVPFVGDEGQVFRMSMPNEASRTAGNLPPRKYQPLSDLIDELNKRLSTLYLQDFTGIPQYPGRNLGGIARQWSPGPFPNSEVRIGDWYYPMGASRWSVFRGLVTSAMAKAMVAAVQAGGWGPQSFVMRSAPLDSPFASSSDYSLASSMYMLPPRPLAETATGESTGSGLGGLYLITLVDERWWWQWKPFSAGSSTLNAGGTGGSSSFTGHPDRLTKWSDLFNQLASTLGITLDQSGITSDLTGNVYGQGPEPDSQFWSNAELTSWLLDAAASNIGSSVVRRLDGSYFLASDAASSQLVDSNRAATGKVRTAGGNIFGNEGLPVGDLSQAGNMVLPETVLVTFPKYVEGDDPVPHFVNPRFGIGRSSSWFEDSFGDVWQVYVTTANVSPRGETGVPGTSHALHDVAKALYDTEADATGNSDPTNAAKLTAMATRMAADYCSSQVSQAIDEAYPGTFAWNPDGFFDIVWTYSCRAKQASTRVMQSQWNQVVRDLQHQTAPVASGDAWVPNGAGGKAVAQTWRDSYSGSLPGGSSVLHTSGATPPVMEVASGAPRSALVQTLSSSGGTAVLADVSFLPTQNRWKGFVDSEIMLLEGTSGGILDVTNVGYDVSILQRGIDGTLAAVHAGGATLAQVVPNVVYGANLVTFEKGQYAFFGGWRSGGIQGVTLPPPLQTVSILDDVGSTVSGLTYYSGQVAIFDPAVPAWPKLENVFVLERNGMALVAGQMLGGQLVGFSPLIGSAASGGSVLVASGSVSSGSSSGGSSSGGSITAPVYAVDVGSAAMMSGSSPGNAALVNLRWFTCDDGAKQVNTYRTAVGNYVTEEWCFNVPGGRIVHP